tara:strand:+ start:63 stop:527 length:465 start_codon:yes stop_codon:yes gene_type:complete
MKKFIQDTVKWYNDNLGCVDEADDGYKCLFILTNIVYFIPILFFGVTKYTIILSIMGIISSCFHTHQCALGACRTTTRTLMWIDVAITSSLGIFLWLKNRHKLGYVWYGILGVALGFYFYGTNKINVNMYMLCHGMWHILTGILFIYALVYESK